MTLRIVPLLVLGLLVTACAGPGPGLTGNDTGGIIPYASFTRAEARTLASEHCARYGKVAHATSVDARYGGYYSFACRFTRHRGS